MNQDRRQMLGEVQKIMATREGQELLKLLSSDGGAALKSAGAALQAGDEAKAKEKMAPLMQNPQVQMLLKSLEKNLGHG